MKVGEDRNFGNYRNLWCIFQFFVGYPAALKLYRSHWKVKKVFFNVENMRTDNFNLIKSLRKTCKWFFFTLKGFFQNISHYISKTLSSFNNSYFMAGVLFQIQFLKRLRTKFYFLGSAKSIFRVCYFQTYDKSLTMLRSNTHGGYVLLLMAWQNLNTH